MHIRLLHFSAWMAAAIFLAATPSFAADEAALGNQDYSKGNFAAAKTHYLKAIAKSPERWDVHYQLANTCLQLKDKEGAKTCYIRCLTLNPSADIRAHCERAVGYLAGLPLVPPPAPIPAPVPKAPEGSSSYLGPTENSLLSAPPAKSDAEIQKEATRDRIMREAEAEIVKMKNEEKVRWRETVSQSNRIFKYSDGSYKRGLNSEETAEFLKEVALKEKAIRDRAQRNCDAIR